MKRLKPKRLNNDRDAKSRKTASRIVQQPDLEKRVRSKLEWGQKGGHGMTLKIYTPCQIPLLGFSARARSGNSHARLSLPHARPVRQRQKFHRLAANDACLWCYVPGLRRVTKASSLASTPRRHQLNCWTSEFNLPDKCKVLNRRLLSCCKKLISSFTLPTCTKRSLPGHVEPLPVAASRWELWSLAEAHPPTWRSTGSRHLWCRTSRSLFN
jgi:hypothetical protein